MPRGTAVPFVPRVPSAQDARPRGEPLPKLFAFLAVNKWPQLAPSTQASYRQTVKLAAALGPYPSVGEVAAWVTSLRRLYPPPEGFSDSWTVHLHWHNLVAVYNDAKEWGLAEGCNPASLLGLKKPRARARAIVGVHELWPRVLDACHDLRERCLLECALRLGARRRELLGLMPHDLVTTGEPWRMRIERQRLAASWATQSLKRDGTARAVPIVSPELRRMLVELIGQGAPRVWCGKGGQELREVPFLFPYRVHELQDLRERLAAVAPSAFPPGDFLHAVRHTFAVELNRSGASFEQAAVALGHTSTQSTRQVYTNIFARPVDVAPMRAAERARRLGVTTWGAPPGGAGPPGAAPGGPEKRRGSVAAEPLQERSKASSPTVKQEVSSCSTPSRELRRQEKHSPSTSATSQTTRTRSPRSSSGRPSAPAPRAPAPRSPRPSGQRALPGLAVQRVTTRPPPRPSRPWRP